MASLTKFFLKWKLFSSQRPSLSTDATLSIASQGKWSIFYDDILFLNSFIPMGDHGFDLFISFFDALLPRCTLGFRFELQNSFFSKYQAVKNLKVYYIMSCI
jgi:hypothetical protein